MTGAYIVITAMAFLLLGMMICVCGFFAWYMLKMIKDLKQAVDLQVKATHELLGEGSFTRISKSLSALSGSMPDILGGIKEFAGVMRMVFKANEEEQPAKARPVTGAEDSAFYPGKTDVQAAIDEVAAEAHRQRIPFSAEEAARAHTDEAT